MYDRRRQEPNEADHLRGQDPGSGPRTDSLFGGLGTDWFLTTPGHSVKDQETGETWTELYGMITAD